MPRLHDFTARGIDGAERALRDLDGRVALVVNVASKCGLTLARYAPPTEPHAPDLVAALERTLG